MNLRESWGLRKGLILGAGGCGGMIRRLGLALGLNINGGLGCCGGAIDI